MNITFITAVIGIVFLWGFLGFGLVEWLTDGKHYQIRTKTQKIICALLTLPLFVASLIKLLFKKL